MSIGLIRALAVDLGVSVQVVTRIASSASKKYKRFSIAKRRENGMRTVAQPAREVKALQRAIVRQLSPNLPMHERAAAYQPGSSILRNALTHRNAAFLLKLDFTGFFPSIRADAISQHLTRHLDGISEAEIQLVLNACLWRESPMHQFGLCIGAPSSPFLSNSVMYEFDSRVHELCVAAGAEYTRYSDDLTFSAELPGVLGEIEKQVRSITRNMQHPNLEFNDAKRVSVSRGTAMRVTGLTLSNQGDVTVGRARKRGVRAGVNDYARGRLDLAQIGKLKGELAFVLSIEPGFGRVLIDTYGQGIGELLPSVK